CGKEHVLPELVRDRPVEAKVAAREPAQPLRVEVQGFAGLDLRAIVTVVAVPHGPHVGADVLVELAADGAEDARGRGRALGSEARVVRGETGHQRGVATEYPSR